ncbi:MAG: thermonuclease family protein [Kiritimatiellia bacterium]|jgi:endonuclease YncB( thermonuclease family)
MTEDATGNDNRHPPQEGDAAEEGSRHYHHHSDDSRRHSGSGSRRHHSDGSHRRSGSGSRSRRHSDGSRRSSGSGSRRRSSSSSRHHPSSGFRRRVTWRSNEQNLALGVTVLGGLLLVAIGAGLVAWNRVLHDRMRPDAFAKDTEGDNSPVVSHGFMGFGVKTQSPDSRPSQDRKQEGLGGRVVRVVRMRDAVSLDVVYGLDETETLSVRLRGIDCLDGRNPDIGEHQGATLNLAWRNVQFYANAARTTAEAFVAGGSQVILRLPIVGEAPVDDYGQTLGYIEVDQEDLGAELLRKGLATTNSEHHPRREEYRRLEAKAREDRIGIFGALGR